jgi:hypothetical protein
MSTILDSLFSSSARVEVLALFLQHPERSFYQREIERETGQPIRAVQREVERFEGVGLLLRSAEGNRVFFRLNPDFPLAAELKALFQKALGGEVIAAAAPVRAVPATEPTAPRQPFPWLESPLQPPLPPGLRRLQNSGDWDRAY